MYGFWLRNQTLQREYGRGTTDGWQAHKACTSGKGYQNSSKSLCDAQTYPQPLYQDDFTATSAIKLLRRRDISKPFFLRLNTRWNALDEINLRLLVVKMTERSTSSRFFS